MAGIAIGWGINCFVETEHTKDLEKVITDLEQQVKRAVIDRSISSQMEEIAYQQQIISEEHRVEAVQQTLIAQDMTRRSETERQHALRAQAMAELSEKEARMASLQADSQRKIADHQRLQAEYSKRVADTLTYISLARSLGSQAHTLYMAGDTVIANLLAYASLVFTKEYGGDLYTPAVFQALTQSSKGIRNWRIHSGGISGVGYFPNQDGLLTVSTYGEIFAHKYQHEGLVTTCLFRDKVFDFRDAYIAKNGKCYAISRTGHLVIVDSGRVTILQLERIINPSKLLYMNGGKQLLIVGEKSLILLDVNADQIIKERELNYNIVSSGIVDRKPLLFDNRGRMHVVNDIDDFVTTEVPVPGEITCFASSKNAHLSAYGTMDGTIYLVNEMGRIIQLRGHLSRITKMKFNGKRLYSSSYDGDLLFWLVNDNQISPITLFHADSWLLDFTYDKRKNYIWTGEANGNLTKYLISLSLIQERIKTNLKRDFTQEEWNYYVGASVPYRSFLNKQP